MNDHTNKPQAATIVDNTLADKSLEISKNLYAIADKFIENHPTSDSLEKSWVDKLAHSAEVKGARTI